MGCYGSRGENEAGARALAAGSCCQQSLTIHLYEESSFFLAVFCCFQLYASHAGLSGAEFSLPPQKALQIASMFPKQSLHPVLFHPCSLCSSTLSPSSQPAVLSQGCVPKSILDITPFSLVKSSLGPKVSHTLGTLMSPLELVLLQG